MTGCIKSCWKVHMNQQTQFLALSTRLTKAVSVSKWNCNCVQILSSRNSWSWVIYILRHMPYLHTSLILSRTHQNSALELIKWAQKLCYLILISDSFWQPIVGLRECATVQDFILGIPLLLWDHSLPLGKSLSLSPAYNRGITIFRSQSCNPPCGELCWMLNTIN